MSPQSLQALRLAMLFSCAARAGQGREPGGGQRRVRNVSTELTKVEVELIEGRLRGRKPTSAGDMGPVVEERAAGGVGPDRSIGADFIAWLCTSPKAAAMVTHKGVRVRGVRVEGVLDLASARVPFPLAIVASHIPDVVDCRGA